MSAEKLCDILGQMLRRNVILCFVCNELQINFVGQTSIELKIETTIFFAVNLYQDATDLHRHYAVYFNKICLWYPLLVYEGFGKEVMLCKKVLTKQAISI